jgi:hypothetical protein
VTNCGWESPGTAAPADVLSVRREWKMFEGWTTLQVLGCLGITVLFVTVIVATIRKGRNITKGGGGTGR